MLHKLSILLAAENGVLLNSQRVFSISSLRLSQVFLPDAVQWQSLHWQELTLAKPTMAEVKLVTDILASIAALTNYAFNL